MRIARNHKSAGSCRFKFREWIVFAFFAISASASVPEEPANKSTEFISQTNSEAKLESRRLDENEAQLLIVKDGQVIGESTYQTEEVNIIIQFEGEPLLSRKNLSRMDRPAILNSLKQRASVLKEHIVQAENALLKQKGKSQRSNGDIIRREYHGVFNGVAARVQRETIKEIAEISGVKKVWLDNKVHAFDDASNQVIRAPGVWSNLGITGSNIVIAILDTGISYTHPDLGGCLGSTCKVIGGYDFVNNDADPQDDYGHGTHCAGIAAANGALHGVAPDAKLMAVKVLGSTGSGSWEGIIAGIEYATDPDGNPVTDDGADVISMSLGGSGSPDDPLSQAVNAAVDDGVVVVVAAGNAGPNYETVQSPGVAAEAITVGATDNNDQLASFSSRGPVPNTWQIKPEVTAPGVSIYSTYLNNGYAYMSGTSMATPHVAGAAALLLQRYPTADPAWIKKSLMQKSADLLLNTFSQGSGRIDVYESSTLAALASKSALSLGVDDKTQPYFGKSESLTLSNHGMESATYNLSISGSLPTGVSADVTPSTLTLAPGETRSFALDLVVDNSIAPDSMTTFDLSQPYNFEGQVLATAGLDTIHLPFAFFKAPQISIQFEATPWFVLVHPTGGGPVKISYPTDDYIALVPEGSCNVVAWFGSPNMAVDVREDMQVTTSASITMSPANAIYPVQIVPTGATGQLAGIQNGLQLRYFEIKNSGLGIMMSSGGNQAIQYFSPMSDSYIFEMSLMGNAYPANGPSYMFHAFAREGVSGSITFQNAASDFRHVINQHHIDPGLTAVSPTTELYGKLTGGGAYGIYYAPSCSNAPLPSPFQEESYLLPAPYPEFHTGYMKKTVTASTSSSICSGSWPFQYETPLIRAKDTSELDGFWYNDFYPAPQFSTTSPTLHSGVGPYSWYGKFFNYSSFILINSDYPYAMASQSRDERPPNMSLGIPYELYRNDALVQSGNLSDWGGVIPVSPGLYNLRMTMNNFYVNGNLGSATVNATFDLNNPDRNPPSLAQFMLKRSGEPTDTVRGGETLRFEVVDDYSGIANASFFCDRGNGWSSLPLTNPSGGAYEAILPRPLASNDSVGVRVIATDAAGNILRFETRVGSSAGIGQSSVPNDFDGDGVTDIAVWRPSEGTWYILHSSDGGYDAVHWGMNGDIPVPGDYDGDGITDIAAWRPAEGTWHILRSSDLGYAAVQWGMNGDVPIPGDYDGDDVTDFAVWRPGEGTWHILRSSDLGYTAVQWGINGDIPVPGDYDGDGRADIAVRRPGNGIWFIIPSSAPLTYQWRQWGMSGDSAVPADYDDDGKTDIAVWRPGEGYWYILLSSMPGFYLGGQWGMMGDRAIAADFDGDGVTDVAAWRPSDGCWYILASGTTGYYIQLRWGKSGDIPLPVAP